jgi:hypothetical protein
MLYAVGYHGICYDNEQLLLLLTYLVGYQQMFINCTGEQAI